MVLYSIEDIILAGSSIQGYMLHIRMCKGSCLKKQQDERERSILILLCWTKTCLGNYFCQEIHISKKLQHRSRARDTENNDRIEGEVMHTRLRGYKRGICGYREKEKKKQSSIN
jgi:hypothetical protein